MSNELNNGVDLVVNKAKGVVDWGVGHVKTVVSAPLAFFVGAVVDNQTGFVHDVAHWVASLF